MATKKEILRYARRRSGKPENIYIDTNKRALSPQRRAEVARRANELVDRRDEIKELLKQCGDGAVLISDLMAAAQWNVDLPGEPAAVESLRDALAAYQSRKDLSFEASDLSKEIRRLKGSTHARKYSIAEYDNTVGIPMSFVLAQADTLDELFEKTKKHLEHNSVRS